MGRANRFGMTKATLFSFGLTIALAGCGGQVDPVMNTVNPGAGGAAGEPADGFGGAAGDDWGLGGSAASDGTEIDTGGPSDPPAGQCAPGAACSQAIWSCSDFCYGKDCCFISCMCKNGSYSCAVSC
jgi:hypothetical protein